MALVFDTTNFVVESDTSITDIVAFHNALRDFEDNPEGIIFPVIHTWKSVEIGGGAFFPSIKFVNGWRLKFPIPGSYEISGGNLDVDIIPVAGVYVERIQSAAYSVTSVGGSGFTLEQIATAVKNKMLEAPAIALESTAQAALKKANLAAALSA